MSKRIDSLADLTGDPKHAAIVTGSLSMGDPVTFSGDYFTGRIRPRRMPRWVWRLVRRWYPVRTLPIVASSDAVEPMAVGIALSPTSIKIDMGGKGDE